MRKLKARREFLCRLSVPQLLRIPPDSSRREATQILHAVAVTNSSDKRARTRCSYGSRYLLFLRPACSWPHPFSLQHLGHPAHTMYVQNSAGAEPPPKVSGCAKIEAPAPKTDNVHVFIMHAAFLAFPPPTPLPP